MSNRLSIPAGWYLVPVGDAIRKDDKFSSIGEYWTPVFSSVVGTKVRGDDCGFFIREAKCPPGYALNSPGDIISDHDMWFNQRTQSWCETEAARSRTPAGVIYCHLTTFSRELKAPLPPLSPVQQAMKNIVNKRIAEDLGWAFFNSLPSVQGDCIQFVPKPGDLGHSITPKPGTWGEGLKQVWSAIAAMKQKARERARRLWMAIDGLRSSVDKMRDDQKLMNENEGQLALAHNQLKDEVVENQKSANDRHSNMLGRLANVEIWMQSCGLNRIHNLQARVATLEGDSARCQGDVKLLKGERYCPGHDAACNEGNSRERVNASTGLVQPDWPARVQQLEAVVATLKDSYERVRSRMTQAEELIGALNVADKRAEGGQRDPANTALN